MTKNLYHIDRLPQGEDEFFEEILSQPGIRIERIVSHGQTSPEGFWYDQDESEWVVLLQGEAVLEFESGIKENLIRGSHCHILPHQKHRVTYTSSDPPCIWLAIFYS